ncbi:BRD4-interacting chromatin-remodeling complex-associated protein-like [Parus major]|uniref:BRD4-interacting chromatin-remodeling complex-associated protein-like n=1 Tax=Parus major TaxID=9157 RepID=UPI000771647B|nr:BRD4-interacting chromatin-remodeling complex-associated protein-like [Parus major]
MKTYEARSRIGLKLKIKQEAGLSKVIHNTALDPPGIPPGIVSQLNGSLEKKTTLPPPPPPPPPPAAPCRLPLRKSYRENRESRVVIAALRRDPGSTGGIRPGKGPPEEASDGEEEEEEEGAGLEPPWGGKRRRAEPLEVDNASFSSDSPQDDSLSEHLQSAIDSILNLQQPRGIPAPAPGSSSGSSGSSSGSAAGSPFPGAPRRSEPLLPPPSHNGGLGAARTCTR